MFMISDIVAQQGETVMVRHLKCEYRVNPLGIDVVQPRLSWILESGQRGQKQTAYQVLAASSEENLKKNRGDLWDSGKVKFDQTIHVVYAGKPLTICMRCYWKVRVWDGSGQPTKWSDPAMWSMGLLSQRIGRHNGSAIQRQRWKAP